MHSDKEKEEDPNKYRLFPIESESSSIVKEKEKNKQEVDIGATPHFIQNCQLQLCHEDNVLYSSGKRSLVVMNLESQTLRSSSLDDERIISAVYHPYLEIYIINTEKKLIAANGQGEIIYRKKIPELLEAKHLVLVPFEDGYEAVPTPNTRRDSLLFTTSEYMLKVMIQIKYERSLLSKNPKSLCSLEIILIGQPEIILYEWVADLKYLSRNNMLVCWNPSETYIYELPTSIRHKEELLYTYDKINRKSSKGYEGAENNKATSYEVSLKHRLLLVSFRLGAIKVYKLDETKKYVCELRGHQRQCSSLYISNQNTNLLYSTGLDNTIRIWDLIDLLPVYQVRLDLICSKLEILNEKIVFGRSYDKKRTYLVKLDIHLLQPLLLSDEKINTKIVHLSSDGEWGIALYSNNLVQAFLLNEKGEKSREFNEKIEFPIKYGFLRSSLKLDKQKYAICLEKGFSILKLNKKEAENENFYLKRLVYNHSLMAQGVQKGRFIQIIHEKLLGTYFFTILHDWKNIPLLITVTSVSLLLAQVLPQWDLEIQGRTVKEEKDYVILGTDRGYIYFIDISNREHYYSRVNFHSSNVDFVERIKSESEDLFFLSISKNIEIVIWNLCRSNTKQPPKILLRVRFTLDISVIKIYENFIVIGCRGGQFNIFEITFPGKGQSEKAIVAKMDQTNQDEGHLKAVISVEYLQYRARNGKKIHLFMTTGEDKIVKIWKGLKKQLIFELKIFNELHQSVFLQQGIDFMISHGENSQISLIRAKNIDQLNKVLTSLDQSQEDREQSQKNSSALREINLSEYLCPEVFPSPDSPMSPFKRGFKQREKEVEQLFCPQENESNPKRSQLKELLKSRQGQQFKLPLFPISERKKSIKKERYSVQKTSSFMADSNLHKSTFLPSLPNRAHYKNPTINLPRMQGHREKGSSIMEKLGSSRMHSYSHAGKNQF